MSKLKVGDPVPKGFKIADCGCVYYAEENRMCPHDILKHNGPELKLKATVKTAGGLQGVVAGIGTELGPDYISVQFSPNGFRMQLHKDSLTVVEDPYVNIDGSTFV